MQRNKTANKEVVYYSGNRSHCMCALYDCMKLTMEEVFVISRGTYERVMPKEKDQIATNAVKFGVVATPLETS